MNLGCCEFQNISTSAFSCFVICLSVEKIVFKPEPLAIISSIGFRRLSMAFEGLGSKGFLLFVCFVIFLLFLAFRFWEFSSYMNFSFSSLILSICLFGWAEIGEKFVPMLICYKKFSSRFLLLTCQYPNEPFGLQVSIHPQEIDYMNINVE